MLQKRHILFYLQLTSFYLTHSPQMKVSTFLTGHLYTTTYLPILLLMNIGLLFPFFFSFLFFAITNNTAMYILVCVF